MSSITLPLLGYVVHLYRYHYHNFLPSPPFTPLTYTDSTAIIFSLLFGLDQRSTKQLNYCLIRAVAGTRGTRNSEIFTSSCWNDVSVQEMSLTSAYVVHSNVYGLVNIHWTMYRTVVDPIHATSSTLHTYHHLTSVSVQIWTDIIAENSSSIRKEPLP